MTGLVAFWLTDSDPHSAPHMKAMSALAGLVEESGLDLLTGRIGAFFLALVGRGIDATGKIPVSGPSFSCVFSPRQDAAYSRDRFLTLSVDGHSIKISNDYAGTIPVFYSVSGPLSISNIAGCVEKDCNVGLSSISPSAVYGFLRFSHFIWDETAFREIRQLEPDVNADWDIGTRKLTLSRKGSLKADASRAGYSDASVAAELNDLNLSLVRDALRGYDRIILPLSAGFDSRMIFSALASDGSLRDRVYCFTYGDEGCVEVEAARLLCERSGIDWQRIDLPCRFLDRRLLETVHAIFGSSLHMHGMYQLEFYESLAARFHDLSGSALTSGFMTGVPAGQHNHLLKITSGNASLAGAMSAFSQSRLWRKEILASMPVFDGRSYIDDAEERFRKAFDSAPGELFHKSIVFDVWTRQRNFISYYPRTLEWRINTISPHMNTDYANFFLSLSEQHLVRRRAVRLMFERFYPQDAGIVSNSNGLRSISGSPADMMFSLSRYFRKLHLERLFLPRRYWGTALNLDRPALRNSGPAGLFPLTVESKEMDEFMRLFGGKALIRRMTGQAVKGDLKAYECLVELQSLAYSILTGTH